MSNRQKDISDDEIRIISSGKNKSGNSGTKNHKRNTILWSLAVVAMIAIGCIAFFLTNRSQEIDEQYSPEITDDVSEVVVTATDSQQSAIKSYTTSRDTIVSGVELMILAPQHSTPCLAVGDEILSDSTIVLLAQAADIRRDNGQIVGAYVVNGDLLSRGEAKSGFCSIVNGDISIGVADATPMLEKALVSGGYFFRQYPLVVGGQIVENKPKGRAIRKALAEIGNEICVIVSRTRLSFHDFSQVLIDAGVSNAIYLVGAESAGFYTDQNGERNYLGPNPENRPENVNYIVWR